MTTKGIAAREDAAMKAMRYRIVSTLTSMAMKFDGVAVTNTEYDAEIDYDHEER